MSYQQVSTPQYYFSAKLFNGSERRFENLDNFQELLEFLAKWVDKGYTKAVVRWYDSNGQVGRRFYKYDGESFKKFYEEKV